MKTNKGLHMLSFILLVVGGLNWLLVGLFQWDVGAIFGEPYENIVARIIYILVGLAALYEIFTHKANCHACTKNEESSSASSTPPMDENQTM